MQSALKTADKLSNSTQVSLFEVLYGIETIVKKNKQKRHIQTRSNCVNKLNVKNEICMHNPDWLIPEKNAATLKEHFDT